MKREQIDFPVIFTTAYDEYAIQALRLRAINYLLKPVNQNELAEAVERFKKLDFSRMTT